MNYSTGSESFQQTRAYSTLSFSAAENQSRVYRLGELRNAGIPVQVGCRSCNQQGYYDPKCFSAPDNTTLEFLADILVCRRCRSVNRGQQRPVWARPDLSALNGLVSAEAVDLARQLVGAAQPQPQRASG
jgi:hypothetical protein